MPSGTTLPAAASSAGLFEFFGQTFLSSAPPRRHMRDLVDGWGNVNRQAAARFTRLGEMDPTQCREAGAIGVP